MSGRQVRYIVVLALASTVLPSGPAIAAGSLTSASVSLTDPRPSATSSYAFTGSSVDTSTAILCVKVVWSTTAAGDTAPAGFSGASGSVDASSSTLINSSATNWSLATSDGTASSGQKNVWKYTNSASGVTPASAGARTFVLTSLTNPSTPDTAYFFKISTYANTDCATSPIDYATAAFINTAGSTLSLTIDQSLSFSVEGVSSGTDCAGTSTPAAATSTATTIPFGSVTSTINKYSCQDLAAATNATNGYTVFARYTAPPTNALSQTIADVTPGTNLSPQTFSSAGTEAYGYTTDDQSLSVTGDGADRFYDGAAYNWAAMSTSNAEVAFESTGVTSTTNRVSHQVGVATITQAGVYATTIIYTCTPVY
jgi:hypothetical protein